VALAVMTGELHFQSLSINCMPNIFKYFNDIIPLSEKEILEFNDILYPIELAKGDYFLKYGKISKKIAFIEEGLLEMTFIEEGSENMLDFLFPNSFASDYLSFLLDKPSNIQITALKNSKLMCFKKEDLNRLYDSNIKFQKIGRIIAERYYIEFVQRLRMRHLPAKERYEMLRKNFPEFIQRIPQYKIASFLGVSAEWLSKLRARK
jgi:CRP-like cAMP-binding protein